MSGRLELGRCKALLSPTRRHSATLLWLLLASGGATTACSNESRDATSDQADAAVSRPATPTPTANDGSTYGKETTDGTDVSATGAEETSPLASSSTDGGATRGATCSGECEVDASRGPHSDAGAGSYDSNDGGADASVAGSWLSPEPMTCELSGHKEPRAAGGELYFLELTCGGIKTMNSRCYVVSGESKSCDCGDDYWLSISPSDHVELTAAREMSIELCNVERTRAVANDFTFVTTNEVAGDAYCSMTRTWRPLVDDYFVPERELKVQCGSHQDPSLPSDEWRCSCEFARPSQSTIDSAHSFSVRPSALIDGCSTGADLCFDLVDAVPRPGATCTAFNKSADATSCSHWLGCTFAAEVNGVTVHTGGNLSVDCSRAEADGPVLCTVSSDVRTATFVMPAEVTAREGCGAIPPDVLVRSVVPSQNPLPTAAELLAISPLSNFEGPAPDVE